MKVTGISFNGTFRGLYEAGKCWLSKQKEHRWHCFWESLNDGGKHEGWHYIPGKISEGRCGSLVNPMHNLCVYLFPMWFNGMLFTKTSDGFGYDPEDPGHEYRMRFDDVMVELAQICKEAAEAADGSFTLEVTKEFEIEADVPYPEYVVTDRKSYKKDCAIVRERKPVKH